jgi:hypothetical protein
MFSACIVCGKEFDITPSRLKKGKVICCSVKCRSIWQTGRGRGKSILIKCVICGVEFKSFKSREKTRKVCHNPDCLKKIRSINLKGVPKSEEHKLHVSLAKIGTVFTEEHRKNISKCKQGVYVREKNPNWMGGISYEPYCPKFNDEFKERCRAFFKYTCVCCGKTQEENKERLSIHHVGYNKNVCCDNTPPLFASLCRSCHAKTQHNREYWEEVLTNKILLEHDGKSYFTKEEMVCLQL